jgi:vacuolar-type H+-ATPase subunit H
MTKKQPVKIIKRAERAANEAIHTTEESVPQKTAQQSARDVVATVSSWVNEFQQKRRNETTQALKTLLAEAAPRPSEA